MGVVLTLMILMSLVVIPATPASAAVTGWSTVNTPSLQGSVMRKNHDVSLLAVAPDGQTMFSYDNVGMKLYTSTNGGNTWSSVAPGAPANGLDGQVLVALAVSSDYANDKTVVALTATLLFASYNGGANWGNQPSNPAAFAA